MTSKKFLALFLALVMLLCTFAGCAEKDEKITVLCTVFPIYDWVRAVVGESDSVEVILLVSDGADLHSYQPTAKDAINIRTADIIVRVGGADDSFVDGLAELGRGIDLRLMEAEGVALHAAGTSSEHHDHDGHEHTVDEHIWLSLKNAAACVEAISGALSSADPQGAEKYRQNADLYIESLLALDGDYSAVISSAKNKKMVFADRFPFVYMTSDYGIEYEAAFEGCTTDAEAGFDTILRLSEQLDRWQLSYIFITENSDRRLCDAVRELKNDRQTEVAVLNSLQSVSTKDIESGATYLKIMAENLSVLEKALN